MPGMNRIPQGTKVDILPASPHWATGERFGWITDHKQGKIWVRLSKSGKVVRVDLNEISVAVGCPMSRSV